MMKTTIAALHDLYVSYMVAGVVNAESFLLDIELLASVESKEFALELGLKRQNNMKSCGIEPKPLVKMLDK